MIVDEEDIGGLVKPPKSIYVLLENDREEKYILEHTVKVMMAVLYVAIVILVIAIVVLLFLFVKHY